MSKIYVTNLRGEKEPFSSKKVYRSAKRVGASRDIAKQIAYTIEEQAYPGIQTSVIFKKVKKLLDKKSPKAALKFNLKKGMRRMGPHGFAFEKYVGEIFSKQGLKIKLNQHIKGYSGCAYEIDFLAKDRESVTIGECKYRNQPGGRVDLPIALENYARFLDIKSGSFSKRYQEYEFKTMLVTNAKFTTQAIKYSVCVGTKLMGWNYPKNRGLEYFIDTQKLYPITILPSFVGRFSEIFVNRRMMLAEDILDIDIHRFALENQLPLQFLESLKREANILLA